MGVKDNVAKLGIQVTMNGINEAVAAFKAGKSKIDKEAKDGVKINVDSEELTDVQKQIMEVTKQASDIHNGKLKDVNVTRYMKPVYEALGKGDMDAMLVAAQQMLDVFEKLGKLKSYQLDVMKDFNNREITTVLNKLEKQNDAQGRIKLAEVDAEAATKNLEIDKTITQTVENKRGFKKYFNKESSEEFLSHFNMERNTIAENDSKTVENVQKTINYIHKLMATFSHLKDDNPTILKKDLEYYDEKDLLKNIENIKTLKSISNTLSKKIEYLNGLNIKVDLPLEQFQITQQDLNRATNLLAEKYKEKYKAQVDEAEEELNRYIDQTALKHDENIAERNQSYAAFKEGYDRSVKNNQDRKAQKQAVRLRKQELERQRKEQLNNKDGNQDYTPGGNTEDKNNPTPSTPSPSQNPDPAPDSPPNPEKIENDGDLYIQAFKNIEDKFKDVKKYAVDAQKAYDEAIRLFNIEEHSSQTLTEGQYNDMLGYAQRAISLYDLGETDLELPKEIQDYISEYFNDDIDKKTHKFLHDISDMTEAQTNEYNNLLDKKNTSKNIDDKNKPSPKEEEKKDPTNDNIENISKQINDANTAVDNLQKKVTKLGDSDVDISDEFEKINHTVSDLQDKLNNIGSNAIDKLSDAINKLNESLQNVITKLEVLHNSYLELSKIDDPEAEYALNNKLRKSYVQFYEKVKDTEAYQTPDGATAVEERAALLNKGELIVSDIVGRSDKGGVDIGPASRQYKYKHDENIHTHPYDPVRNRLRFSIPDIEDMFAPGWEFVKRLSVLCGEEIITMDLSKVNSLHLDDLYENILDIYDAVFLRYGAEIKENGNVDTSNLSAEMENRAVDTINTLISKELENVGGKLSFLSIGNFNGSLIPLDSDGDHIIPIDYQEGLILDALRKNVRYSRDPEYIKALSEKYRVNSLDEIEAQKAEAKQALLNIQNKDIDSNIKHDNININEEYADINNLKHAIDDVTTAVRYKTEAFLNEQEVVSAATYSEINDLSRLEDQVRNIRDEVDGVTFAFDKQTGILNNIFSEEFKRGSLLEDVIDKETDNKNTYIDDITNKFEQFDASNIISKINAIDQAFYNECEIVDSVVDTEVFKLNELENKLHDITAAVNEKNDAFKKEADVLGTVLAYEQLYEQNNEKYLKKNKFPHDDAPTKEFTNDPYEKNPIYRNIEERRSKNSISRIYEDQDGRKYFISARYDTQKGEWKDPSSSEYTSYEKIEKEAIRLRKERAKLLNDYLILENDPSANIKNDAGISVLDTVLAKLSLIEQKEKDIRQTYRKLVSDNKDSQDDAIFVLDEYIDKQTEEYFHQLEINRNKATTKQGKDEILHQASTYENALKEILVKEKQLSALNIKDDPNNLISNRIKREIQTLKNSFGTTSAIYEWLDANEAVIGFDKANKLRDSLNNYEIAHLDKSTRPIPYETIPKYKDGWTLIDEVKENGKVVKSYRSDIGETHSVTYQYNAEKDQWDSSVKNKTSFKDLQAEGVRLKKEHERLENEDIKIDDATDLALVLADSGKDTRDALYNKLSIIEDKERKLRERVRELIDASNGEYSMEMFDKYIEQETAEYIEDLKINRAKNMTKYKTQNEKEKEYNDYNSDVLPLKLQKLIEDAKNVDGSNEIQKRAAELISILNGNDIPDENSYYSSKDIMNFADKGRIAQNINKELYKLQQEFGLLKSKNKSNDNADKLANAPVIDKYNNYITSIKSIFEKEKQLKSLDSKEDEDGKIANSLNSEINTLIENLGNIDEVYKWADDNADIIGRDKVNALQNLLNNLKISQLDENIAEKTEKEIKDKATLYNQIIKAILDRKKQLKTLDSKEDTDGKLTSEITGEINDLMNKLGDYNEFSQWIDNNQNVLGDKTTLELRKNLNALKISDMSENEIQEKASNYENVIKDILVRINQLKSLKKDKSGKSDQIVQNINDEIEVLEASIDDIDEIYSWIDDNEEVLGKDKSSKLRKTLNDLRIAKLPADKSNQLIDDIKKDAEKYSEAIKNSLDKKKQLYALEDLDADPELQARLRKEIEKYDQTLGDRKGIQKLYGWINKNESFIGHDVAEKLRSGMNELSILDAKRSSKIDNDTKQDYIGIAKEYENIAKTILDRKKKLKTLADKESPDSKLKDSLNNEIESLMESLGNIDELYDWIDDNVGVLGNDVANKFRKSLLDLQLFDTPDKEKPRANDKGKSTSDTVGTIAQKYQQRDFDAKFSSRNKDMDKYIDYADDFAEIKNAQNVFSEYKDSVETLKRHFSEDIDFELDSESVVAEFEKMISAGKEFDNLIKEIKNNSAISNLIKQSNLDNIINDSNEVVKNRLAGLEAEPVEKHILSQIENLNQQLKDGEISVRSYLSSLDKLTGGLDNVCDYAENADQALSKMTARLNPKDVVKFSGKLYDKNGNETGAKLISVDKDGYTTTQIYDNVKKGISSTVALTQQATSGVGTFFASLKGKWGEVVRYFLSFGSLYEAWDILRQGSVIIRDLDDALTEMNKVSDEPLSKLQEFQKQSFDIAKDIGSTGQQIQLSTADFLRLGEEFEAAKKSASSANVLFNVSEFESIDEATTSLIAMSSAYDDLDKMQIVDKLNKVGNSYAISTDGIATALQKSASALKTTGVDIDKAIALITAGNAVVQDPESVGAGIRTIALRMAGTEAAKKELENIGEDTSDFVVQTTSKIDESLKAFTAVASNDYKGISMLDANGNNRNTYDVLLDIAEIYDEIVETDKKFGTNHRNGLLELIAGKNRSNIAASIIQNAGLLKDVYKTSANDSQGSAMEENQKHLDSISGHIDLLQNKWQELWSGSATRDQANTLIDIGTYLLDIVDKIGLVKAALAGGGIFLGLKDYFSDGIMTNLFG